jgi:hypothetical protein
MSAYVRAWPERHSAITAFRFSGIGFLLLGLYPFVVHGIRKVKCLD